MEISQLWQRQQLLLGRQQRKRQQVLEAVRGLRSTTATSLAVVGAALVVRHSGMGSKGCEQAHCC
jgi:hypothetical protein